ncbi:MAG: S16 family serine protease [Halobacteriota archaeon]|nr:S16 family serine protease [Halobacteriota archaeon]
METRYQETVISDLRHVVEEQEILIAKLKYTNSEEINFTCPVVEEAIPVEGDLQSKSARIVAVKREDNSGSLGDVFVEVKEGKGRVLVNTNPFVEADTQHSAKIAVGVAENYTGKSLLAQDVIITFDMNDTVLLGGPSAGAAITAVTIAAIEGREIRDDVVVTGTIEPSGWVGTVGGILEKAQTASDQGMSLLLVPHGELQIKYYERVIKKERFGFFTIERVRYEPRIVDLNEYLEDQDMEVKEVFTIEDVVGYMLK